MTAVPFAHPGNHFVSAEWKTEALCQNVDPDIFFPMKGKPARVAKRICAGCKVKAICLLEALRHHENEGVWGGTTPDERKAIYRRMPKARRYQIDSNLRRRTEDIRGALVTELTVDLGSYRTLDQAAAEFMVDRSELQRLFLEGKINPFARTHDGLVFAVHELRATIQEPGTLTVQQAATELGVPIQRIYYLKQKGLLVPLNADSPARFWTKDVWNAQSHTMQYTPHGQGRKPFSQPRQIKAGTLSLVLRALELAGGEICDPRGRAGIQLANLIGKTPNMTHYILQGMEKQGKIKRTVLGARTYSIRLPDVTTNLASIGLTRRKSRSLSYRGKDLRSLAREL